MKTEIKLNKRFKDQYSYPSYSAVDLVINGIRVSFVRVSSEHDPYGPNAWFRWGYVIRTPE